MAKDYLDSNVEFKEMSAYDVSMETAGSFDFVLCSGVIYHISNPYEVIERAVKVAEETVDSSHC